MKFVLRLKIYFSLLFTDCLIVCIILIALFMSEQCLVLSTGKSVLRDRRTDLFELQAVAPGPLQQVTQTLDQRPLLQAGKVPRAPPLQALLPYPLHQHALGLHTHTHTTTHTDTHTHTHAHTFKAVGEC